MSSSIIPQDAPVSKQCSVCKQHKSTIEFYKRNGSKDGFRTYCRECSLVRTRTYYKANRDRLAAYGKANYEANKDRLAATRKAWREANHEKEKSRVKAWSKANSEKVKARGKAWRKANPEKTRASTKAWRDANPEKVRAQYKDWHKKNPDMARIKNNRRKARKRGAEGTHTAAQIRELFLKQRGKCAYCKTAIKLRVEVEGDKKKKCHADHIIALKNGGSNYAHNIQLLCPRCNCSKGAADPIEFAQQLGLLL